MFNTLWNIPTSNTSHHKLTLAWLTYNMYLINRLSSVLKVNNFDIRSFWLGLSVLAINSSNSNRLSINNTSLIGSIRKPKITKTSKFTASKVSFKTWSKLAPISTHLPSRILQIFQATFQFTMSFWPRDFNPHPAFRLLFMRDKKSGPSIISFDYYFKRWKQTYLLLYNLFFAHNALPTFGSRVFKTEILALNWSFDLLSYKLFKYSSPFFIFEDESYGFSPLLVLKRWRRSSINYLFLLELKIFKKFQHFFKTLNFIIIGLVPMNSNPWLVSYPIPAFSDSRFIQYYFIKLITFIRQNAAYVKFSQKRNVWLTTLK